MPESITAVARRALVEADQVPEFAKRMKRKFGWRSSARAAHQRVLQLLNSGYGVQRHLPADVLLDVVELTGSEEIEDQLRLARERGERARLQRRIDELEARESRRAMRTVRPADRVNREVG